MCSLTGHSIIFLYLFPAGCDPTNKPSCLRSHPDSCLFRKVECPARKCLDRVTVNDLCQHLADKHEKTTVFTRIER